MAFGQLQDEVSGMSDEAPAGLEQPLLETRQGPALDGRGQDEPSQKIADVIRDNTRSRRTSLALKRWQERRVQ